MTGDTKVISGQGMPYQRKRNHEHGDLFVELLVQFPERIDANMIPLLKRALAPRTPSEKFISIKQGFGRLMQAAGMSFELSRQRWLMNDSAQGKKRAMNRLKRSLARPTRQQDECITS